MAKMISKNWIQGQFKVSNKKKRTNNRVTLKVAVKHKIIKMTTKLNISQLKSHIQIKSEQKKKNHLSLKKLVWNNYSRKVHQTLKDNNNSLSNNKKIFKIKNNLM